MNMQIFEWRHSADLYSLIAVIKNMLNIFGERRQVYLIRSFSFNVMRSMRSNRGITSSSSKSRFVLKQMYTLFLLSF